VSVTNLTINGIGVSVAAGATVLEAARAAGIRIPTLCYMRGLSEIGACRICNVEVKGMRAHVAACVYPVFEGMEVFTNSAYVRESRKMNLELLMSNHRRECMSCPRSTNCELQNLALEYGASEAGMGADVAPAPDFSAPHLVRDNSKCIFCRRCEVVCRDESHVGVIGANGRGYEARIGSPFDMGLGDTACIHCGRCVAVCPTAALMEKDDTPAVWAALDDANKHVVIAAAPAVAVQLGEMFGMPIGENVSGKIAAAMKMLGFDRAFDIAPAADLTIMEEGAELISRLNSGENLPMFTSCCPSWVKFCEYYYPDWIDNISTCKPPQLMFGALMKSYYAEKTGINPADMVVVTIMPCTAKKFEITRTDDIDITITTREFAAMIRRAGIMFESLPDTDFDPLFGISSGAANIFAHSGGVAEAALRGIKDQIGDKAVKIKAISGLSNAKALLDKIRAGEEHFDFVEIMGCPGGCINGGGQPQHPACAHNEHDILAARKQGLRKIDNTKNIQSPQENPIIKELYTNYLEKPASPRAHELLHTHYTPRDIYE